jgi:FLVCR family MFS transporter
VTSAAVQRVGPRKVTLACAWAVTAGACLRLLPLEEAQFKPIILVSMALNGVGGTWLNFGGPIVSEAWFPAGQRTTATAIGSVATYTGVGIGFIVGPAVVGVPITQSTAIVALRSLFWCEAAVCLVVLLCVIVYYPDQPELPPSEAAAAKRASPTDSGMDVSGVTSSMLILVCGYRRLGDTPQRKQFIKFWALALLMALPVGVSQAWGSTLNLSLSGILNQATRTHTLQHIQHTQLTHNKQHTTHIHTLHIHTRTSVRGWASS